jgi:hypothetical protein
MKRGRGSTESTLRGLTKRSELTADDLGRTKQTQIYDRATGSDVLKFTFATPHNLDDSPATISDGSNTLTYVYDNAGRLDQFKDGATVPTDNACNSDGTLASRTDGTLAATRRGPDRPSSGR